MQTEGGAPLSGADAEPQPTDERARRRLLPLLLAVAGLVWALDQLTKILVVRTLADRGPVELLGGLLKITYTRNPGAAFSIGTGTTWIFTAVALAVVVVILRTSSRIGSVAWAVALGALLGGALGNLTDRLFRAPGPGRGYVVDWIQVPHWPVFNLADSAIVCSAVAMVVLSLLGRDLEGPEAAKDVAGGAVGEP